MIPVKVGGEEVRAILDTGASIDVFAPSVIQRMNGKPTGQFTGFRMSGERLDGPLFIISELSIGPMVKKNVTVGSMKILDEWKIGAIISMNDFREQAFTLDFARKMLTLETAHTAKQRGTTGKWIPLAFDDQRGIALDLFADFTIGNQRAQCLMDTGDPGTAVNSRFMQPLGLNQESEKVTKQEGPSFTGAKTVRYKVTLEAISLAQSPEIRVMKPAVAFSNIIYDCVIGLNFWAGKSLTINIPNRTMLVQDSSTSDALQ